jgi:hypothetical protein
MGRAVDGRKGGDGGEEADLITASALFILWPGRRREHLSELERTCMERSRLREE